MSFSNSLERALERGWYSPFSWTLLLLPLSWVFRVIACLRRYYRLQLKPTKPLSAPVIVVGNISIGGTGKTPLLLTLIHWFQEQGYRPGVISRGYGGTAPQYPLLVKPDSMATEVGDEPLLLAKGCPVVVDPNRYRGATHLLEQTDCNLILSDDGLQHYRLPRDIEIVVVDGQRGFGNRQCLPAGPLREPVSRLNQADFILVNGAGPDEFFRDNSGLASFSLSTSGLNTFVIEIKAISLRHLGTGESLEITSDVKALDELGLSKLKKWRGGYKVHAVAGIGNPQRFVTSLKQLGFEVLLHAWPDHHRFTGDELDFDDDLPVIITAKDAVKCGEVSNDNVWVLDVMAKPEAEFLEKLANQVVSLKAKIA